jgi:hypothetical protein
VAARGCRSCSLSLLRACMWWYPIFRVPTYASCPCHQQSSPTAPTRTPSTPVAYAVCTSSVTIDESSHELTHAVGEQETHCNRQGRRRLQSPRHADVFVIRCTRKGLPFQTVSGILRGSCWMSRTFFGVLLYSLLPKSWFREEKTRGLLKML